MSKYYIRGYPAPLIIISFFTGITWGLMSAVIAPYLKGLGYTATEYGILGSLTVLSSVLFTFASGVLSDYLGAKKIFFIGLLLSGTSFFLISSTDKLLIMIGYLLLGSTSSLAYTASSTLVARSVPDDKLHYMYSYIGSANTLGIASGGFLGWIPVLLSGAISIPIEQMYIYTIIGIGLLRFAISPLALLVSEVGLGEGRRLRDVIQGFKGLGIVYWIVLLNILIGFGAALSIHNIDYYFTLKFNVSSGELGSIFGIENLIMAFIMYKLPGLADRLGGAIKLYILLALSSLPLLIGMTLTDIFFISAFLFIVRTILMNVANPLYTAFIMRLIPHDRRGVGSALFSLAWNIPAGLGRAVGGYILDIDIELPLRLTTLFYGVSIAGLAFLVHIFRLEKKDIYQEVNA